MAAKRSAAAPDAVNFYTSRIGVCKGCVRAPKGAEFTEHEQKRIEAWRENEQEWLVIMNSYMSDLEVLNKRSEKEFGIKRVLLCCMDMDPDVYQRDMVPYNKLSPESYEPLTAMVYAAPYQDMPLKEGHLMFDYGFEERLLAVAIDLYKNRDRVARDLAKARKPTCGFEASSDTAARSLADEVLSLVGAIIEREGMDLEGIMAGLPKKYRTSPEDFEEVRAKLAAETFGYGSDFESEDSDSEDLEDSEDSDDSDDEANTKQGRLQTERRHSRRRAASAAASETSWRRSGRGRSRRHSTGHGLDLRHAKRMAADEYDEEEEEEDQDDRDEFDLDAVMARRASRRASVISSSSTSSSARGRHPNVERSDEEAEDGDGDRDDMMEPPAAAAKLSSRRYSVGNSKRHRNRLSSLHESISRRGSDTDDDDDTLALRRSSRSQFSSSRSRRHTVCSADVRRDRRRSCRLSQSRPLFELDAHDEEMMAAARGLRSSASRSPRSSSSSAASSVTASTSPPPPRRRRASTASTTSSRTAQRRRRSSTGASTLTMSSAASSASTLVDDLDFVRAPRGSVSRRDALRTSETVFEEDEDEEVDAATLDPSDDEEAADSDASEASASQSRRRARSPQMHRRRRASTSAALHERADQLPPRAREEALASAAAASSQRPSRKSRRASLFGKRHSYGNATERKQPLPAGSGVVESKPGQFSLRASGIRRWIKDREGMSFRWSDKRKRYERVRFSLKQGPSGPVCVARPFTAPDDDSHVPSFPDNGQAFYAY